MGGKVVPKRRRCNDRMSRLESRGVPWGRFRRVPESVFGPFIKTRSLTERPAVGWIEAHTENYFHEGGAGGARARARAR